MAARRIKKPKSRAASQALEQLVTQFSDPLAFLRELVQNSLDAATELIEVEVEYDEQAKGCVIRVRDTGVGMDRDIIDTKLTRLFSSSKENDLTKIGKFGIGFVSIFAIEPQLVVLETGRDGESWRIIFHQDRSFERRQLDSPVEGTSVSVFTSLKASELPKLQKDCLATVAFWCRHSEVEIHFNGKRVNEPFQLPDTLVSYHHQVEGTDAVVAASLEANGFQGYYNRGLTLLEGLGSPLPHVSFKLRSRYLEHTLTRDNIIHDEGYEKALAEVRIAAYDELPKIIGQHLQRDPSSDLWKQARVATSYPGRAKAILQAAKIFPVNLDKKHFGQLTPPLLTHPQVDEFWLAAEAAGHTIVCASSDDSDMLALLADWGMPTSRLSSTLLHYRIIAPLEPSDQELLEAISATDKSLRPLLPIEALQTPTSWTGRFCGYVKETSQVSASPLPESLSRSDRIGIFLSHPFWGKLKALHTSAPELAIALACRKLSLDVQLGTDGDSKVFDRLSNSVRSKVTQ